MFACGFPSFERVSSSFPVRLRPETVCSSSKPRRAQGSCSGIVAGLKQPKPLLPVLGASERDERFCLLLNK
jgi:hypothetical protein